MKFRFSEKQLLLVTLAVFLVVVLPLAVWGYFLHFKSWANLNTELSQVGQDIIQAQAKQDQMYQLQEKKKKLKEGLKVAQEVLPTVAEVSYENFLELLGRLKKEAKVELFKAKLLKQKRRVGPGQVPQGAFDKVSYELELEGRFYELVKFVYLLESYKRFIRIDSFGFKPGGTSGSEPTTGGVRHGLKLKLTTYTYKE